MNCGNNSGEFVYGPYSKYTLVHYQDTKELYVNNSGPFEVKDVEFGIGNCNNDKKKFMHAVLEPVFNEKAYNEAKKVKSNKRPIIIYFLTLDGVSRRHFYRKLPKTMQYFNNLKTHHLNIAIYDFKLHNVFGRLSVENQVPIFGKYENYVSKFSGNQYIDKLGKNALWNILRNKGFISLLGFDDCDYDFADSLGRNPNVDYNVRQFYCYMKLKTGVLTDYRSKEQRCIGPYMNHYYILNYTHSVAKLNQGVNQ